MVQDSGNESKHSEVPAGDSRNEVFNLQTIASIKDGKQHITALGSDFSDAIEKPVTVHPDGEERAETVSNLLDSSAKLAINLPVNTIANSAHIEAKIYPNLMTHVWESVEAIMKRPYGCGEQTISSTYPSLLVLRYVKDEKIESPVTVKARKYLDAGYQRLLGYQSSDGGFTYWGHGDSDVALTAYALRFLNDASTVMTVDKGVVREARQWLLNKQRNDGSWQSLDWYKKEDPTRTAMLTALVARSLAVTEPKSGTTSAQTQTEKTPLARALAYLESKTEEFDEPYLLASYSLASSASGDIARADKANRKLKSLAHSEGPRTYWALETNTPFYGWGLAGTVGNNRTRSPGACASSRPNRSGGAKPRGSWAAVSSSQPGSLRCLVLNSGNHQCARCDVVFDGRKVVTKSRRCEFFNYRLCQR